MSLIHFNTVRDLSGVEKEFNRIFSELESRFSFPGRYTGREDFENADWSPSTDIFEDSDTYKLILDLPGLQREDVKISYLKGSLKVTGERSRKNEEEKGKYHRIERTYGKFYRSFSLPDGIKEDKIDASFENGQLVISIPKAEEVKPKELEIKVK